MTAPIQYGAHAYGNADFIGVGAPTSNNDYTPINPKNATSYLDVDSSTLYIFVDGMWYPQE